MPQPTTNNLEGWRERFKKQFIDSDGDISCFNSSPGRDIDGSPDYYVKGEDIIQFISDLRKHDMEELIKYLDENGYHSPNLKGMINYYYNK